MRSGTVLSAIDLVSGASSVGLDNTRGLLVFRGSDRPTVQREVVGQLRLAILNGQLPGGTRLIQAELAESLGVSTTPIREALRLLEAEGLIRIDTHRGGVVRQLTQPELADLVALRLILEPEAMRRAVPVPSDILDRAHEIHNQMVSESVSSGQFAVLNREFHLTIYRSAKSEPLTAMLKVVMDPVVAYVSASLNSSPELRKQSLSEHAALLQALREHDVDRALAIQLEHVKRPRHEWLALDSE